MAKMVESAEQLFEDALALLAEADGPDQYRDALTAVHSARTALIAARARFLRDAQAAF